MKIGLEVEGRLKGIPTLFTNAEFVRDHTRKVQNALRVHSINHLYISDNSGILTYEKVGLEFSCYVTMDVTKTRVEYRPSNITLMLRVDPSAFHWLGQNEVEGPAFWSFTDIECLREGDQIKFERDRHVFVFPVTQAIKTAPADFEGDLELDDNAY
ncbi:hypothetical protein [Burkholderia phage BCSR5]|nr:hypothetical protein [Burkholderia phage BCSR5]